MHPSGDPIRLLAQPMEREFEDMMCWWPHPSTNLLLEARSGVSVPFRVMSMPIQRRLSRSATADVVPQPQNGSSTRSPSLLLARMTRSSVGHDIKAGRLHSGTASPGDPGSRSAVVPPEASGGAEPWVTGRARRCPRHRSATRAPRPPGRARPGRESARDSRRRRSSGRSPPFASCRLHDAAGS